MYSLMHGPCDSLLLERKVCEHSCSLDFPVESSLVLCACSGDACGEDLASLCDIAAEHLRILVISRCCALAELADLLLEAKLLHTALSVAQCILVGEIFIFVPFVISYQNGMLSSWKASGPIPASAGISGAGALWRGAAGAWEYDCDGAACGRPPCDWDWLRSVRLLT